MMTSVVQGTYLLRTSPLLAPTFGSLLSSILTFIFFHLCKVGEFCDMLFELSERDLLTGTIMPLIFIICQDPDVNKVCLENGTILGVIRLLLE